MKEQWAVPSGPDTPSKLGKHTLGKFADKPFTFEPSLLTLWTEIASRFGRRKIHQHVFSLSLCLFEETLENSQETNQNASSGVSVGMQLLSKYFLYFYF